LAAISKPSRARSEIWPGLAREVANFRHPKIASIRLAGDPNGPVLPQDMTLDEPRDSIKPDIERLRETGVLDLPRLLQGVVDKS
jgi:hypothetical protein